MKRKQAATEECASSQLVEHDEARSNHIRRFSKRARTALGFAVQMLVLVAVYCLGTAIASVLPIALPGNILGMLLLLVFLAIGVVKLHQVNLACEFMLDNMPFFFIPAGVAVMGCFSLLAGSALKFLFICVITTILTFGATSYTVAFVSQTLSRRTATDRSDKNGDGQ